MCIYLILNDVVIESCTLVLLGVVNGNKILCLTNDDGTGQLLNLKFEITVSDWRTAIHLTRYPPQHSSQEGHTPHQSKALETYSLPSRRGFLLRWKIVEEMIVDI